MLLMRKLRPREMKSCTLNHFSESEKSGLRPKFLLLIIYCFYRRTDFIDRCLKRDILNLSLSDYEVEGKKLFQLVSQNDGQRPCPGQCYFNNVTTELGLLGAGSGVGWSGVKEYLSQLYDFQLRMYIIPSQWNTVKEGDFMP